MNSRRWSRRRVLGSNRSRAENPGGEFELLSWKDRRWRVPRKAEPPLREEYGQNSSPGL